MSWDRFTAFVIIAAYGGAVAGVLVAEVIIGGCK